MPVWEQFGIKFLHGKRANRKQAFSDKKPFAEFKQKAFFFSGTFCIMGNMGNLPDEKNDKDFF